MKLDLGAMGKQLLPEQTDLSENVNELTGYVDEVLENVRRLYLNLTPGDLEDLGLTAALKNLCEEFGRHHEKISWSIHLDTIDGLFPLRVETAVYRIFQEILTNIGKHADPSEVAVTAQNREGRVCFKFKITAKVLIWIMAGRVPESGHGPVGHGREDTHAGRQLEGLEQEKSGNDNQF